MSCRFRQNYLKAKSERNFPLREFVCREDCVKCQFPAKLNLKIKERSKCSMGIWYWKRLFFISSFDTVSAFPEFTLLSLTIFFFRDFEGLHKVCVSCLQSSDGKNNKKSCKSKQPTSQQYAEVGSAIIHPPTPIKTILNHHREMLRAWFTSSERKRSGELFNFVSDSHRSEKCNKLQLRLMTMVL